MTPAATVLPMRPTHLVCGVALAGALLTGGCGSDREPEKFTTAQVAEFFHAVTGDSLRADSGHELDALSIERGDSGRYGTFYIVVMRKPDEEDFYKIERALPLKADPRGIYWHEDGASWTAMKRYGNVVLAWDADQRELDDRFERLHTVLTGLGEPPAQVRAKLTGGAKPGSGSTLIVGRGERLRLPHLEIRLTRVETGQVVIPPNDYGLVRRAKGRFVLAAVELKNLGDEPLRGLYDARLKVGDRIYAQSSRGDLHGDAGARLPAGARRHDTGRARVRRPARRGRAGGQGGRARLPPRRHLRVHRERPDPARTGQHTDLRGRKPHRRRDAAGQAGQ